MAYSHDDSSIDLSTGDHPSHVATETIPSHCQFIGESWIPQYWTAVPEIASLRVGCLHSLASLTLLLRATIRRRAPGKATRSH